MQRFGADHSIRKSAMEKRDSRILAIASREIIAAEACYHSTCYKGYTRAEASPTVASDHQCTQLRLKKEECTMYNVQCRRPLRTSFQKICRSYLPGSTWKRTKKKPSMGLSATTCRLRAESWQYRKRRPGDLRPTKTKTPRLRKRRLPTKTKTLLFFVGKEVISI